MTQPARKPTAQVVAYIGREVSFTDSGFGTLWQFGCIPGGCTPDEVHCLISDGFSWSAGTDYTVTIGTAAEANRWFEQGFSGASAARIDRSINADKARPMGRDSEAFISIKPVNPAGKPTAGHAVIWMTFLPHPLIAGSPAIPPGG